MRIKNNPIAQRSARITLTIGVAVLGSLSYGQNAFPTSGNVGIGTNSPNKHLHIKESAGSATQIKIQNGNSTNGGLILGIGANSSGQIKLKEDKPLKIFTNNTEQMRLTSEGFLGLGTDAPLTHLHIKGDHVPGVGILNIESAGRASIGLNATSADAGIGLANSSVIKWSVRNWADGGDAFVIGGSNFATERYFTITPTGNVGIGTDAAPNKLTVNGSVQSRLGGFVFPDGSVQTSAADPTMGSQTNPYTELFVQQFLKVGPNSIYIDGQPSDLSGVLDENHMYTSLTPGDNSLFINCADPNFTNPGDDEANTVLNAKMNNGHVGIGTDAPVAQLDIELSDNYIFEDRSGLSVTYPSALPPLGKHTNDNIMEVRQRNNDGSYISRFEIKRGGQVEVGPQISFPTHADYRFSVDGKIVTRKLVVTQQNWSDFVFEEDYNLPGLEEEQAHVLANKHLIGIPSAKEVAEQGLDLGDMDAMLLQKIEEMYLYMFDLQDQVEVLQKQNEELKQALNK